MTISLQALRDKRDQLAASLAGVDDLRPGFLTARFRKCGKPNCHCAQEDSPGHGPSYSLTHREGVERRSLRSFPKALRSNRPRRRSPNTAVSGAWCGS
jgi:hypothetical protein